MTGFSFCTLYAWLVTSDGNLPKGTEKLPATADSQNMLNTKSFVTQTINLKSGWNIFSVFVNPDNREMKNIFQTLISDGSLIKVQDQMGKSLEDYGIFGGWRNNIGNISPAEGYKVKTTRDCQLNVEGIPVSLPFEIPLKAGWNIMGYPMQTETDGMLDVQPMINRKNLVKVQDETGKSIEDFGIFGGWINNIGNFKPGEGYKVKVIADEILSYAAPGNPTGSFMDSRDGKVYKTVKIGSQWWMSENLAWLPSVNPPSLVSDTSPYCYVYDYTGNDVSAAKATVNFMMYGALYNWPAALNGESGSSTNPSGVQGICPSEWHLPSHAEWVELENYLVSNGYGYPDQPGAIAKSLASTANWAYFHVPRVPGYEPENNNRSGFTGLPGGELTDSGVFWGIKTYAIWWTSTEYNTTFSYFSDIYYSGSYLVHDAFRRGYAYSVRCIKN